jgi:signal transduction histidine kinase/DNA-binding response OmpR family regulator
VMQSLASYTAIALDNANAYRQLNEQEHEIRRLFEEAERARAIAEEADAAKSSFLSTVSHELRTPLTSVLGFAKIIKKRLEDRIFPLVRTDDRKVLQTIQQVEDNLRVVVSEGERLTKLIDDVLDLAKIEAGKLEWHMEPTGVLDVVDRATAATSSLLDQKKLRLVTDIAPGLPTVTGDRDRLIQVVINLISNAVKFTDEGTITCRAERRGDELVVSVIDTGMGISPSDQPKVFERFKQVGDTLTDKPKGTGLGLPICREIVEHHGGRIWVTSEIGVGSTFSFSLPVSTTQAFPGGGPVPPMELAALIRQLREQVIVTTPRTADHQQPRILVVDDDPNIRELLTQEFTEAGYQVMVAGNGREALLQVRNERPDLIVLDVMMPEMNGFDVAAVLKNDPSTMSIPIVILSIVEDQERGFRLGVDRYLTKPIDTELLFREVGSLIEQKTSHKRVLVVDEDESTVRTLADVLKARGYTVLEARGEDLLERAVALQPDIIMLNSVSSARSGAVQMLRFEKGMENVLFLLYQ